MNTYRDLGIIVEDTLKPTAQCLAACRKANSILGMMRRGLESRSREVWLPVYRSLVRPHLEYCVQACAPYYKKDIKALERIQKRATKLISGMGGLAYEDRLKELKLFSLERRRVRGDLIQVFKFIKNVNYHGAEYFFQFVGESKTRGHHFKLQKQRPRLLMRQHFFSDRVVDEWNGLPSEVVEARTVGSFKTKLDDFSNIMGRV
jgi:ribonuclease P/MRP protein subunit RPP40